MQVEFQATEEDYKEFLVSYFFKNKLLNRLSSMIVVSLWAAGIVKGNRPFSMSTFLLEVAVALIISFIFFVLIPYGIAKAKYRKAFNTALLTKPKTLVTDDEGITIKTGNDSTFWKWETLKAADKIGKSLFISLFTNKFYLIPSNSFVNDNEAINFLGVIKNNIQKVRGTSKFRKINNLYYWGLVGFIPNFGVVAGIILIAKSFQYNKIALFLIGVADISFTFFFWMVLLPLIDPNGFKDISQMQLNDLIKKVEFYKLQNGQYPDSLQQLLKDDRFTPIRDAIQVDKHRNNTYYNYEKVGDKYFLFSSGLDGIPNTADDLHPIFSSNDSSKIGLIKSR